MGVGVGDRWRLQEVDGRRAAFLLITNCPDPATGVRSVAHLEAAAQPALCQIMRNSTPHTMRGRLNRLTMCALQLRETSG